MSDGHASSNSAAIDYSQVRRFSGEGERLPRHEDATRNRVPTEDELAEVMAACWDHGDFHSTRTANGYPKMAAALRAFLLERAT